MAVTRTLTLPGPCDNTPEQTKMLILPLRFPDPRSGSSELQDRALEEEERVLQEAAAVGWELAPRHCSCLQPLGTLCSGLLAAFCLTPCLAAFLTCLHLQENFSCHPWHSRPCPGLQFLSKVLEGPGRRARAQRALLAPPRHLSASQRAFSIPQQIKRLGWQ